MLVMTAKALSRWMGKTGYLATALRPSLSIGGSSALTVATWVRLPSGLPLENDSRVYPLITFGSVGADAVSVVVKGNTSGADLILSNATTALLKASFDRSTIADGNWHHLGFIADGRGVVTLYFDGRPLASKAAVTFPVTNSPRVCLGRDAAGHLTAASFDNAFIRQDALTANDFQNLYNTGLGDSGLPDWWKWARLGKLNVDPNEASVPGGLTNLQKYQAEVNPAVSVQDIPNLPAGRGVRGKVLLERWSGPRVG